MKRISPDGRGCMIRAGASGSGEGLDKILANRPHIILYYDEFSAFLTKALQKGNTLIAEITRLFEEDCYQNMLVKDSNEITGIHFSFSSCIPLGDVSRLLTDLLEKTGFLNRLFFVLGQNSGPRPHKRKLPDNVCKELEEKFRGMIEMFGPSLRSTPSNQGLQTEIEMKFLLLSAAAEKIYTEWYVAMYERRKTKPYLSRLDNYFKIWLAALTISKMELEISEETAQQALKIIEYQEKVREWAWSQIQDVGVKSWVERIIKRVKDIPGKTKGMIARDLHAVRDPENFERGFGLAIKLGGIKIDSTNEENLVYIPAND